MKESNPEMKPASTLNPYCDKACDLGALGNI